MPSSQITFPGIQGIHDFSITQIRGIVPSTINISISPQSTLTTKEGTVSISYNSNLASLTRTFPSALIDTGSLRLNPSGHIIGLKLLDRRWKWKYGYIRGRWNIYEKDSTTLISSTIKTPQDLASILLDAMGETGYDVSELPNDSNPSVQWSYTNPAEELFSLCEKLGCYIILEADNTIKIYKESTFTDPGLTGVLSTDYGIDTAEIPSAILVVLGPTKRQLRLNLEAIGLDTDKKWKPINDLSYTPSAGWETENYRGFYNVREEYGEEEQKLAKQTVFKVYRIVDAVADSGGFKPEVTDPENIYEDRLFTRLRVLPTYSSKLETTTNEAGETVNQPPEIRGVFWDGNADFSNTNSETPYEDNFRIDRNNGHVIFNNPVIKLSGTGFEITEADLTLEISVSFKPTEYEDFYRSTFRIDIGDTGVDELVIKEDSLEYQVIYSYDSSGNWNATSDNLVELETEVLKLMQGEIDKLVDKNSFNRSYTGLRNLTPNGAITQVVWNAGKNTPAKTTIGVHQEADTRVYHERFRTKDILEAIQRERNREGIFFTNEFLGLNRRI